MTRKDSFPPLRELLNCWAQHPRIQELRCCVSSGAVTDVLGLTASAPAFVLAQLHCEMPLLVVAENADAAGYMLSDLEAFGVDRCYYYPSAYNRHIKYGQLEPAFEVMRAEVLTLLATDSCPTIVTYPEALLESIPTMQQVSEVLLTLQLGDHIDRTNLREQLGSLGFQEVDYVYEPGQVAYRGSLVDLFSYGSDLPYRIDFFDDEVESIRHFDVETQLSEQSLDRLVVTPRLHPESASGGGASLVSLLPSSYVVWVDRLDDVLERAQGTYDSIPMGEGFPGQKEMRAQLCTPARLYKELCASRLILSGGSRRLEGKGKVQFHTQPLGVGERNFDLLVETLEGYDRKLYQTYFLSGAPPQVQRLEAILCERKAEHVVPRAIDGVIHGGFEDADLRHVLLTDHELFARYHKYQLKSSKIRNAQTSLSLKDLQSIQPGDYIVHSDHGIGRFDGLLTIEKNGQTQEVIKLLYQNNALILVSIHSLRKLSKYMAQDDVAPELSKLGSGAWKRLKERTKAKVKTIARDLIALYAARKEQEGFAFSPDSYLQYELEASFEYEETPDQLKALAQIKADMESPKPMDRLVCGDVGFGKTEVAIRAAFKAVADSKQVAVLVPTTVLAYQHYQTFSQRLKGLPCRVEYLSRAKNARETKQILSDLSEGHVDIIIGTHKLVMGKGVTFRSLGLLIIDEEQKFGVAAKEKIRKLQVNVDTLTLSATPIPRTLEFSLMGARDLSNINTPPRNRRPVSTQVIRWSEAVIADAINYELARHGQVFFVHNRIQDIHAVADDLQAMVPGVRIAVAHGRMTPSELEEIVLRFAQEEFDLLLSTTIIENGVDMPRVNTILINEAHRYGLSALHQLRGRVGRSSIQAYCYLITPPLDGLPKTAARRVRAIESFSDLGSGIRIALQDLDIRGAGNLLGVEQSGFILDMGFETYRKVFDEAVREVKREEFSDIFFPKTAQEAELSDGLTDTVIDTDMYLTLPPDYVPQDSERISLYRALDALDTDVELERFARNLKDRFGPIPAPTQALLRIPRLRRMASHLGLVKVMLAHQVMVWHLPPRDSAYYQSDLFTQLLQYVGQLGRRCVIKENEGGRRCVRFDQVPTVFEAEKLLEQLYRQQFGDE